MIDVRVQTVIPVVHVFRDVGVCASTDCFGYPYEYSYALAHLRVLCFVFVYSHVRSVGKKKEPLFVRAPFILHSYSLCLCQRFGQSHMPIGSRTKNKAHFQNTNPLAKKRWKGPRREIIVCWSAQASHSTLSQNFGTICHHAL